MSNFFTPEELEKRIIEKIKKLNPGELPSHKTQIAREIELYKRGYTEGYIQGYLTALIEKRPIDSYKQAAEVEEE